MDSAMLTTDGPSNVRVLDQFGTDTQLWCPSTQQYALASEVLANKAVRRVTRRGNSRSKAYQGSSHPTFRINLSLQTVLYFSGQWCARKFLSLGIRSLLMVNFFRPVSDMAFLSCLGIFCILVPSLLVLLYQPAVDSRRF